MKSHTTVLLIEDNAGDARLLREMFNEGSYATELMHVGCMSDAELRLAGPTVDVILLDLACRMHRVWAQFVVRMPPRHASRSWS